MPDINREIGSGFLPEDYEVPHSGGNYLKLREGDNKVRILASPLLGWIHWEETPDGRRPVRCPMVAKPGSPDARHFWAVPVWDYGAGRVAILEIVQYTIQEMVRDLATSEDWGSPLDYDVTITRKGSGLETEYSVRPSPKSRLPDVVRAAVDATPINIKALFENGNPFEAEEFETI